MKKGSAHHAELALIEFGSALGSELYPENVFVGGEKKWFQKFNNYQLLSLFERLVLGCIKADFCG